LIALVQLLFAIMVGWFLTERWQRWRQRRDFQYRTLGKFSELSYEMMDRLSELLVGRGKLEIDKYRAQHRELVSRWSLFVSMRGEVMAAYGRQFTSERHFQGRFASLNALRSYVRAQDPVPQERFEPEQEKFFGHREAVVAEMVRAMGLLSKQDCESEIAQSESRIAEAERRIRNASVQSEPGTTATNTQ